MAQTHVCPLFLNLHIIAPATAASISASSKTINGAFPPNSIEHFIICSEACLSRILPTSVEPVKVSFLIIGFSQNSFPISDDREDGMIDKIPFGRPALSARMPIANADNGVSAAGLAIKAHPAARAGPAFLVIMAFGKFQGVIDAATPTGCFKTVIRLSL